MRLEYIEVSYEWFRKMAASIEHLARCRIFYVKNAVAYRPAGGW